jgi:hypothetical protein
VAERGNKTRGSTGARISFEPPGVTAAKVREVGAGARAAARDSARMKYTSARRWAAAAAAGAGAAAATARVRTAGEEGEEA